MRRDALAVLFARGWASALTTWKGLLAALLVNVALSLAISQPVVAGLHGLLDRSTFADRVLAGDVATFHENVARNAPGLLGTTGSWDALLTGGPAKKEFFRATGAAGAAVWGGLAMAFFAALLSAGFAGRFGAEEERGSLAAFGADVGRFGLSSLVLGAVSVAGIVAAYRLLYVATGDLYDASELRYEWEAVGLTLLRLLLFLVVAGLLRLLVLYARAAMGLRKSANLFVALARALGFLLRRPVRVLALEVLFGAAGLVPLALWVAFAPSWDGKDPGSLALLLLGQQLVVLWRIAARTAHLGTASAFLRRAAEPAAASPAAPDPSEG